ncbi:MAG: HlyD family type I secretion periplasmic adaptor subunit [Magnetococcales bacterium]|nr:HlyD family type I secretion periplasmic adaptor subunit [Magnetococcales bacterium]MBF0150515.1 HlyD family type I secretion periplasmic adaptor subunit [Magnetococcales bacterium]
MASHIKPGDRTVNHLAKSVLLEESGSPWMVRLTIRLGLGAILFFIIWATWMELDEVARATGETVPRGQVQKVQHFGGGSVAELLVADGQEVTAGAVLIRLDPVLPQSQALQTEASRQALWARLQRLHALSENKEPDFAELKETTVGKNEHRLWSQEVEARRLMRATADHRIAQARAELEEMEQNHLSLQKQLALLLEEMKLRKGLVDQGLNSKVQYLTLQRRHSEIEGELAQTPARRKKLEEKILEEMLRLQEQEARENQKAMDEASSVAQTLADTEELLVRHRESLNHLEIRAPVAGRIHHLQKHAVGEVIASGETILEIVPLDQDLVAEIRIVARDVGHVAPGQPVILKFSTYDFARYGGVNGVLKEISPTSLQDETKTNYFKGTVTLQQTRLGGHPILPGMTLQADILTGRKSVLEYLLKPIFASSKQALQER